VRGSAPSSILARVGRQAGWLLGANLFVLAIAFGQNLLLARRLGPAGFGALALVFAVTDVTQQLLSSRVWETATTFVPSYRAKGEHASAAAVVKLCLLVDAVAALLATALLTLLAEPFARWFVKSPEAVGALRLYALLPVLLIPVATGRALLRLADRYRWLSWQLSVESVVRVTAVLAALAIAGAQLRPVVAAYLAAAAAGSVMIASMSVRAWRDLGLPPWPAARLSALGEPRRVLRFLAYSNASGTFRLLSGKADVLVLGWFADPSAVGAYRLARTVADPLVALTDPVYQATYPEMSRLVHEGDAQGARGLAHGIRVRAWLFVIPVCAVVTLAAAWVIPAVFGSSFEAAVPLTRILVWQLVWVPYLWVPGLLLALGRADVVTALTAADAVAFVAMLLLLVPAFGAVGAAVATVARFAVWATGAAALGRRATRDLEVVPA
jgi:O-antigen/teichoic acid export membrane protein